jgi:hypothetical protein
MARRNGARSVTHVAFAMTYRDVGNFPSSLGASVQLLARRQLRREPSSELCVPVCDNAAAFAVAHAIGRVPDETNNRRRSLGNDRAFGRRVVRSAAASAADGTGSRATFCFHASASSAAATSTGRSSRDALPGGTALGARPPRSPRTLGRRALSAEQSSFVGRRTWALGLRAKRARQGPLRRSMSAERRASSARAKS